jgi:isoamylase
MAQSHWEDGNTKCLGMLVDGRAQKTGVRKHGADTSILIVMNSFAAWSISHFAKCEGAESWSLLADTNVPARNPKVGFTFGKIYQVTGRSLLLFAAK